MMTEDLWADLRELLDKAAVQIEPTSFTLSGRALREILTDADALLGLKEYAGHKQSCELPEAGVRGICDCGFTQALAALPEHLKERKAT